MPWLQGLAARRSSFWFSTLLVWIGLCSQSELSATADEPDHSVGPTAEHLTDAELLEFVRQRSVSERVTRTMVFMDYWMATRCVPPVQSANQAPSVHANHAIHVYTNNTARAPIWDPFESFPIGSLIVKEKLDPWAPGEPELFTGMLKREKGFASEAGDWEFFTVDGGINRITARGKLEACIACHRTYAESDYVTRSYASRALPPFSTRSRMTELRGKDWAYLDRPVCWAGEGAVILPAAWATISGREFTERAAQDKWRTEQLQQALQSNTKTLPEIESPPGDLTPWGGPKLRYEPTANKNTLGYWTEVDDSASWLFEVPVAGSYEVQVFQGCGQGQGGSRVAISIGTVSLTWEVEDTGHFQNFVWKTVGHLDLIAGQPHQLLVKPQTKTAQAILDLRQIRLIPR